MKYALDKLCMYKLLISYSISAICSWVGLFIFPLIILELTNSPLYVSTSYAIQFLPYIIVTPLAGVLGDYYNKKRILQIGEIFACIICCFVGMLNYKSTGIYVLFIFQFSLSSIVATQHPIFQSLIPSVVQNNRIDKFNSYVSSIDNTIALCAPILSGLFISYLEKGEIWQIIGGGYLFSALLINIIKYEHKKITKNIDLKYVFFSLKEGFNYVLHHSVIRNLVTLFLGVNLGIQIFYSNYIFILKNAFGILEANLSYYFIPSGACSIVCALITPYLLKKFQPRDIIISVVRMQGLLLISLVFFSGFVPFISMCSLVSGCTSIVVVTFFTLRQKLVPNTILSRVVAISRMLAYLSIPIGAFIGGYILNITKQHFYISTLAGIVIILSSLILKNTSAYKNQKSN